MALALDRLDVGEVLVERRSERRLRLMLQYASDVILILDHDLTIVHVTPAVEPIVGMPAPELLGMNWLDVVAESDRDAARDLVSLAQGGRPVRGEVRLNNEDGHTRHVDAVVTEVIDEDLMGFVVTCHDVTERHELEQQLIHQAFHDALTGLANRALFRDRLGHAMARDRGAGSYGVLFIDLDDFKTVNDSLGHAAGDALLREMTTRLRACLRDGDTAARLGGDEFAILLEDVDDDDYCVAVADRLIEALSVPFDVGGTEVTTGASIGIALGQNGPAVPEDLMRNADLALYDAKNSGKNRYAVFATTMHEAALARLSLTSELRHAIERNELVVYYQPLVDLESGAIDGLEALVRWQHPRARPDAARPVHRPRRGDRADHPARSHGAAHRTVRGRALAEPAPRPQEAAHGGQRQRPPAARSRASSTRSPPPSRTAASTRARSCSRSPRACCCPATAR